jgi:hypothetical protein
MVRLAIVTMGLTICSAVAAQTTTPSTWVIVVAEPVTLGVDPESASTFADLVRLEVGRQAPVTVLPRSRTPPQPCGDVGCGVPLAQQTGATAAVVSTLSRLGEKVIVRYEYVHADGRVLMTDRATAASLSDLEPLTTRVGNSIATGRPIGQTITTSTVTQQEAREPTRRRAVATWGLHMGALAPVADSYGGSGPLADLGLFAFLELHSFAAVAEVEILWTLNAQEADPTAFGLQLNLGGRYFLDPESDMGVFLGGGVGFRLVAVDNDLRDESQGGIGVYGGAGIVFLRTADLHVILDARYDVNLFSVENISPGGSHGLMISLGLSYTKWGRWR